MMAFYYPDFQICFVFSCRIQIVLGCNKELILNCNLIIKSSIAFYSFRLVADLKNSIHVFCLFNRFFLPYSCRRYYSDI